MENLYDKPVIVSLQILTMYIYVEYYKSFAIQFYLILIFNFTFLMSLNQICQLSFESDESLLSQALKSSL